MGILRGLVLSVILLIPLLINWLLEKWFLNLGRTNFRVGKEIFCLILSFMLQNETFFCGVDELRGKK